MASPIGHVLAGYAVGRLGEGGEPPAGRLLLPACAFLAVAPDLDFLPGLLVGQPVLHHQGASHSLLVAAVVGLAAALLLVRDRRLWLRAWALFAAAYASHLAIDWLGSDGRPPIGIPLLWPASDATWLSPVQVLPGIHHTVTGLEGTHEWLAMVFSPVNLRAIAAELILVGPLVLLAEWTRRRRAGADAQVRPPGERRASLQR
jgi:inner membrane protein